MGWRSIIGKKQQSLSLACGVFGWSEIQQYQREGGLRHFDMTEIIETLPEASKKQVFAVWSYF
jgi:hypothetical protein